MANRKDGKTIKTTSKIVDAQKYLHKQLFQVTFAIAERDCKV